MSSSHCKRKKAAKRFQQLRHVVLDNAWDLSNRVLLERMNRSGGCGGRSVRGVQHNVVHLARMHPSIWTPQDKKRPPASDQARSNTTVVDEYLYESPSPANRSAKNSLICRLLAFH